MKLYPRKLKVFRRKFFGLGNKAPMPDPLYPELEHGPSPEGRSSYSDWDKVYDNFGEGYKIGYPFVDKLGTIEIKALRVGQCPTCGGHIFKPDDVQRSAIAFCSGCRKQFTLSEFNFNDRGNFQHNPDMESPDPMTAWNEPAKYDAQFDVSQSPDPTGLSMGRGQY